jgi:membrane dipeptidase
VSGSAHGVRRHGLTELGRRVIERMEQKRMTVDLAHASAQTIDDVLAIATRPVVVSHTGVRGTCDNNRNLSDVQLQRIARNGGILGIGYWKTATCGTDAKAIARAIRYSVGVAGIDHVALGSDYDGAVSVPFDAAGLVELTDALLEAGFDREQLRKIMGGNVLRVLRSNLP